MVKLASTIVESLTLPEAYNNFQDMFLIHFVDKYQLKRIIIPQFILLKLYIPSIDLFTAFLKINSQNFKHILTRTWSIDLSDYQSFWNKPLFYFCRNQIEGFDYM